MKYLAFLLLLLAGCRGAGSNHPGRQLNYEAFGRYWYQGQAEISTYALEQFRYGEARPAEAVLIFVTEDLSRQQQVKLDNPAAAGRDAQKVLKLNLTKKFVTGVYPYSMMLSAFVPVYDSVPAVKLTASVQEWCGQTYTQLNHKKGAYHGTLHSYFETEGDQEIKLKARAEDELWNLIRLSPGQVPQGKTDLIPGLLDQRFTHLPLKAYPATVTLKPAPAGRGGFEQAQLQVCEVVYTEYPRQLRIYFTRAFPYQIAGWDEVHFTKTGKPEISRARRQQTRLLDYWNKNKTAFEPLRDSLGLQQNW